MNEAVQVVDKEHVLGEKMEVPNTDFYAVRRESYTELCNADGDQVCVLPPQWSLFDIEFWCSGYVVGVGAGEKRGAAAEREEMRKRVIETLKLTEEMDGLRAEIGSLREDAESLRSDLEDANERINSLTAQMATKRKAKKEKGMPNE